MFIEGLSVLSTVVLNTKYDSNFGRELLIRAAHIKVFQFG